MLWFHFWKATLLSVIVEVSHKNALNISGKYSGLQAQCQDRERKKNLIGIQEKNVTVMK